MAKTREIKRRIKSVSTTAQMTHAMELVAAAKMRASQARARSGRPYGEKLNHILRRLLLLINEEHPLHHPLMEMRPTTRTLIFLITPDKGLCGALTSHIVRTLHTDTAIQEAREKGKLTFLTFGKKGRRSLVTQGETVLFDVATQDPPTFDVALRIARLVIRQFTDRKIDQVLCLYAHFTSTIKQEARVRLLLPIHHFEVMDAFGTARTVEPINIPGSRLQFITAFEPNAAAVLSAILPHYIEMWVYQILLEAAASEHSARMVAMKQATENAHDLIADLRLTFNRVRQETITRELLDIITGRGTIGGP